MDAELVTRAQRGDQAAFARLLEIIDDRFHGVAYGILRDMHLAEDAVQGAMLKIWRDLPQLREPAAFDAWAYRLLVRTCQSESKQAKRWIPALAPSAADPRAARDLAMVADRDQLERGFRHLTVQQRSIIVLHHYLDLPHEEAAEILGVSVGTARSRLSRALQALRAALEADARRETESQKITEAARWAPNTTSIGRSARCSTTFLRTMPQRYGRTSRPYPRPPSVAFAGYLRSVAAREEGGRHSRSEESRQH